MGSDWPDLQRSPLQAFYEKEFLVLEYHCFHGCDFLPRAIDQWPCSRDWNWKRPKFPLQQAEPLLSA